MTSVNLTKATSAIKDYQALKQQVRDHLSSFQHAIKDEMMGVVKDLVAKYPQILGVCWQQFTPYFNDGDACVFYSQIDFAGYITEDAAYTNMDYAWEFIDEENDDPQFDTKEKREKWYDDIGDDISKALAPFDEDDLLLILFGDHVQVNVYPDRIDIEEYGHHD